MANVSCRNNFDAVMCEYKAETSPESTLELVEQELWLDLELILKRLLVLLNCLEPKPFC